MSHHTKELQLVREETITIHPIEGTNEFRAIHSSLLGWCFQQRQWNFMFLGKGWYDQTRYFHDFNTAMIAFRERLRHCARVITTKKVGDPLTL